MTAKERNYENLAESIIAKLAQRNMEGILLQRPGRSKCKSKAFFNAGLFDLSGAAQKPRTDRTDRRLKGI